MFLKHKNSIGGSLLCLSHLFAAINLHGYAVGPTPEGVELFSDSKKTWFWNYHTSLVAAIALRYAHGRIADIIHSLERRITSHIKLRTLSDVGSIFKQMASGEMTPKQRARYACGFSARFGPELAERIERYVNVLPQFT